MTAMKERKEFVILETKKGTIYEVSKGEHGERIIKARSINLPNEYSKNYVNPPIPRGYKHLKGTWDNGFVIERNCDGSQFTWIPVGYLDPDGMLDGKYFSEKFGRRNFLDDEFSSCEYNEPLTEELLQQLASIKKYGGYYISSYNISLNSKENPQSVKGVMPLVNISYCYAKALAESFECNDEIRSHLPYGAEYDTVLAWLKKSKARTYSEIVSDSSEWGNYWNTKDSPKQIETTGSCERWNCNNISDLAGNIDEWTQEKNGLNYRVVRGGIYRFDGEIYPVSHRSCSRTYYAYPYTGLRVVLCIK